MASALRKKSFKVGTHSWLCPFYFGFFSSLANIYPKSCFYPSHWPGLCLFCLFHEFCSLTSPTDVPGTYLTSKVSNPQPNHASIRIMRHDQKVPQSRLGQRIYSIIAKPLTSSDNFVLRYLSFPAPIATAEANARGGGGGRRDEKWNWYLVEAVHSRINFTFLIFEVAKSEPKPPVPQPQPKLEVVAPERERTVTPPAVSLQPVESPKPQPQTRIFNSSPPVPRPIQNPTPVVTAPYPTRPVAFRPDRIAQQVRVFLMLFMLMFHTPFMESDDSPSRSWFAGTDQVLSDCEIWTLICTLPLSTTVFHNSSTWWTLFPSFSHAAAHTAAKSEVIGPGSINAAISNISTVHASLRNISVHNPVYGDTSAGLCSVQGDHGSLLERIECCYCLLLRA